MRNHITPEHSPLSDPAVKTHHAPVAANSDERLELPDDDQTDGAAVAQVRLPSKGDAPSSDFEGFGSFSG